MPGLPASIFHVLDYRHVRLGHFYMALGIKPRASCSIDTHFTNSVPLPFPLLLCTSHVLGLFTLLAVSFQVDFVG